MRFTKFSFILLLAGLCLIVALLLTACGKSGGDKGNPGETVSSNDNSESLFTIRYRPKWHPQAQFAGVYMASKKGFYTNYGLNVITQTVTADEYALTQLESGNSDIVLIDLITALKATADSTWLVNLAQVSQKTSIMLVAKKSRGFNSINSFNGKKLGLWQSGSSLISEVFLRQNNLTMQIIPVNWSVSLFLQDVVDVINAMRYNEYHQLIQAGLDESDLFSITLSESLGTIPEEGFYTSRAFYEKYPRQCRAFAEATMDGWLYAFSNQVETVDTVIEVMNQAKIRANRPHQEWMLNQMKEVVMGDPANIGKLTRAGFDNTVALIKDNFGHQTKIKYEDLVPYANQK